MRAITANERPPYDRELQEIADYVLDFDVTAPQVLAIARLRLADTVACALDALAYPDCVKLIGPVVPGTVVPHGARVLGTAFQLDPVKAAFDNACLIRWLDYNDTFTAAQGSHPSDNLAGVLSVADHVSRRNAAGGRAPLVMRDVLAALVKVYEIQGCLAIENDFNAINVDHVILTRVATAAAATGLLGGNREDVLNAVSNAWLDTSIRVYRQAPNTGWRKSWATAKAGAEGVTYALMALKGERGYPSALTAKQWGFYDTFRDGAPFAFQRSYGTYVIENSMFKFVAAGMHGQSAVECAFRLHPQVKDRLQEIARIEIHSQRALMGIMDKTGPLHNPADRDHSVQYIVAFGLIHGRLDARDFEDEAAADPRIDALRAKMTVVEDPAYSRDFYDPAKRSSANAVQVFFKDGSATSKIAVEYPYGHPRRLQEAGPVLAAKFRAAVSRRYSAKRAAALTALCEDQERLEATAVHEFMDAFAA